MYIQNRNRLIDIENNICGKEDSTCVVLEVRDYGMRGEMEHRGHEGKQRVRLEVS